MHKVLPVGHSTVLSEGSICSDFVHRMEDAELQKRRGVDPDRAGTRHSCILRVGCVEPSSSFTRFPDEAVMRHRRKEGNAPQLYRARFRFR